MWVVVTYEASGYYIRGIYSFKKQAEKRAGYLRAYLLRPVDIMKVPADTNVRRYIGGYTE